MNRIITFFLLSCISTALIVSCQKEYSLELNKIVVDTARGSLKDSVTGNCLPSVVNGTFYNGVATSADTNYLQLTVNVTALGAYQISTDFQNGFSFSDSGSFTKLGYDTIRLKASGTPALHVVTDFTISFDSSICSFSVNVKDSTGTGLGGNTGGSDSVNKSDSAWQFSNGTQIFHGSVDSTIIFDTTINSQSLKAVTIEGRLPGSGTSSDTLFYLGIAFPGGNITTGTYVSSSLSQIGMLNSVGYIYQADATTTGYLITVIVTAYDSGTGIIEGTFTGTAKTASGGTITVSGGKFKAKIT